MHPVVFGESHSFSCYLRMGISDSEPAHPLYKAVLHDAQPLERGSALTQGPKAPLVSNVIVR